MIIDADGHIHVPNIVFDEYLDPAFRAGRPRYVELDDGREVYRIEGRVVIMCASDYPHPDSKWPHTVSPIQTADLTATAKQRILGENAARLYGLD